MEQPPAVTPTDKTENTGMFLPFPKGFWEQFDKIEALMNFFDPWSLTKEQYEQKIKDGWICKFYFKMHYKTRMTVKYNKLVKVNLYHTSRQRLNAEMRGWHMDGGLFSSGVKLTAKDGTIVTNPEKILNVLCSFEQFKPAAERLHDQGWPMKVDEKYMPVLRYDDDSSRHWFIHGNNSNSNNTEDVKWRLYGTVNSMQLAVNALMYARQDLQQWIVRYSYQRKYPHKEWPLWEEIAQHNFHQNWDSPIE